MASNVTLKTGDQGTVINGSIREPNGSMPPLETATAIILVIKSSGGSVVRRVGEVVSATTGAVRYTTVAGDHTLGTYQAEWEVTYASGRVQTYPGKGYLTIEVGADLG